MDIFLLQPNQILTAHLPHIDEEREREPYKFV